jgi:plastocyanin
MRFRFHVPATRSRVAVVTLGLALVTLAAVGARRATDPTSTVIVCTSAGAMSEAQMASLSAAHYAAVPPHGAAATTAVAATFRVLNYQFDADNNLSTLVDEVHILQGQSVMFQWVAGIHTSTSGNPGDIDAGSIWDFPVSSTHLQTVVTFPTPGTYPFHCLFHGDYFGMVGTIVVDPIVTPTASTTWGKVKARYR